MTVNTSIRLSLPATSFAAQSSLVSPASLEVERIASLPTNKLKQLTTSQIQTISTDAIKNLTPGQISALTTDQIVSLIGAQIEALQTNQLTQLSVKQIRSLEAQDVSLLSTAQIATLNRWQISGLNSNQIRALNTNQIQAINLNSISALTNSQIEAMSSDQTNALTSEQSSHMGVNQLFKASLKKAELISKIKSEDIKSNPASIKALSSAQVAQLTTSQVTAISPNDFGKLKNDFFTQLSDSAFSALTRMQIGALTTAQVSSLSTSKITLLDEQKISALKGIEILTTLQLGALSTSQVTALSVRQVNVMTASQVGSLTSTQVKAIEATDFAGMKQQQISALSATQLNAISSEQVSAISAKKLNLISTDVLRALSPNVISSLTSAQVQHLNGQHLTALSVEQLNGLSDTQIKSMAPKQVRSLTNVQISGLSSSTISALSVAQFKSLTSTQIASIGEEQAAGLSSDKLASLNNSQLASLTATALGKLNETGALNALSESQKRVPGVSEKFISPVTIYTYKLAPSSLLSGQSVTIAGLTFTATKDVSANDVLKAFSNLKAGAQQGAATDLGLYTGKLINFSTSISEDKSNLLLQSSSQTTVNDPPAVIAKGFPSPKNPIVSVSQGAEAVAFRAGQPQVLAYALPGMNVGDVLAFNTAPNISPTLDNEMVFRCIQKIDGTLAADGKATTAVTNAILGKLNGYLTVSNRNGVSYDGNFSYYGLETQQGILLAFAHNNLAMRFTGVRIYNHDPLDYYNRGIELTSIAAYSSQGVLQINPVAENTEYAQVVFNDLKRGQSISLAGLEFQAKSAMSAEEVAMAFANITSGSSGEVDSSKGQFTGALTGYATSASSNGVVLFTSTTTFTNVPDLPFSVRAENSPEFNSLELISKAVRKNGVTVSELL